MMLSAACAIGALMIAAPELKPDDASVRLLDTKQSSDQRYAQQPVQGVASKLSGGTPANTFVACPTLLTKLPSHLRPAEDRDRSDAKRGIPRPGEPAIRLVTVFTIDAPVVHRGGRRAAVLVTWACPGLCGGGEAFFFKRVGHAWRRAGRVQPLWIS